MKQTPKRLLCIALLVAMLITAALPCFAQDGNPTLKVTSSHVINYGSEASLVDGVYGGYGVDDGGWVYVQTITMWYSMWIWAAASLSTRPVSEPSSTVGPSLCRIW